MNIRLFTIPNILTLANLACGVLAVNQVIAYQDFTSAFWLVMLSAVFDFCDGFAARLLHQASPIGKQLDSLADMVSFGLVPSMVLFWLYQVGAQDVEGSMVVRVMASAPLLVALFSALRLAKFNIDESQSTQFIGLPTPANAILCVALGYIYATDGLLLAPVWYAVIAVVMASLLIMPIKMFALKFKNFGWRDNWLRYSFVIFSCVAMSFLKVYALPLIIVSYIILGALQTIFCTASTNE